MSKVFTDEYIVNGCIHCIRVTASNSEVNEIDFMLESNIKQWFDSLEFLNLIQELEWKFSVSFSDEELHDLITLKNVVESIANKLNK